MRTILWWFLLIIPFQALAISQDDLVNHWSPEGTIFTDTWLGLVGILSIIQSILLTIALPVVVVGSALYVAYQLFTAEGDESKMKKAWKSLVYGAIALIAIALSYAFVTILSTIDL